MQADMDGESFWILGAAVFLAYVVKGSAGFANTLVFGTVSGFFMDNRQISPVELVVGYPSNLIMALRGRKELSFPIWGPGALFVVAGGIPGMILLKSWNPQGLKRMFGLVILLAALQSLYGLWKKRSGNTGENPPGHRVKRAKLAVHGIFAGFICGLFGVGAFLAAYMGHVTENQKQFKGNISMIFLVENTIRVISYMILGILNRELFLSALALLPFMAVGLVCGFGVSSRIREDKFKMIICILLILSGMSLVIRG